VRDQGPHGEQAILDAIAKLPDHADVLNSLFGAVIVRRTPELIALGWADDEIWDAMARFRVGHRVATLREQRAAEAYLALLRGQAPPSPPRTSGPTEYARAKIAQVPEAWEYLRRSSRRGPTKMALAARLEVDRKTLDSWIRWGWLRWPPA
jgi:hypothetical protein